MRFVSNSSSASGGGGKIVDSVNKIVDMSTNLLTKLLTRVSAIFAATQEAPVAGSSPQFASCDLVGTLAHHCKLFGHRNGPVAACGRSLGASGGAGKIVDTSTKLLTCQQFVNNLAICQQNHRIPKMLEFANKNFSDQKSYLKLMGNIFFSVPDSIFRPTALTELAYTFRISQTLAS